MNAYQWIATGCVSLTVVSIAFVSTSNPILPRQVRVLFSSPNSLGSVAIGMAEGTRTVDGGKTAIWRTHIDPGNGAKNQGTFSNQVDGKNPEEADRLQLDRVRNFAAELLSEDPELTALELLGGADLYNQAPKAAAVYVEHLKDAKEKGLSEKEAIVEARVNSFFTPEGKLDAPGLRNDVNFVKHDQGRRMSEIQKALGR
ncbi:MAG: hypothetical protein SWY16_08180 [Cyanobacteriota bacterium]|nr:hypothetical protein [Cyanobacteriota bacterium]